MTRRAWIVMALWTGCRAPDIPASHPAGDPAEVESPESRTTELSTSDVEPDETPRPAPESAPEAKESVVPELQTLEVELGVPVTSAEGIEVRWTERNHKHAVSGETVGIWELELERNGAVSKIRVQDQELYAEVDAFDRLIVFSKIDSNTVRARIHRERPTPLEEDAAAEVIRKRLAEWGVSFAGASTGHSSRYGVLRYSVTRGKETIAEASFGLFTGEMLSFERPLAAAYRARPRRPVEKLRLRSGGKVTTKDGIVIRWERRSHKHKVGGGAVGIWSFRVSKDGKSRSIGVTSESLYAELLAFERVFTLSSIDYDTVEVGVHTKRRRMSDHRALRKAQDLGKRIGMDSDGSVLSEEAGAHEFILRKGQRDLVWGKIGAYTHAIVAYILRDRPADAAERPPL